MSFIHYDGCENGFPFLHLANILEDGATTGQVWYLGLWLFRFHVFGSYLVIPLLNRLSASALAEMYSHKPQRNPI